MVQEPEREAGEVEVPLGKHSTPPTALTEHSEEYDNEVGMHDILHAATLAVEPPPNEEGYCGCEGGSHLCLCS